MKQRKKNILQITLYLEIGGLEAIIVDICKHIDKKRYNISVLCLCGYDPSYKNKLENIGITVNLIKKEHKFDLLFFRKIIKFIKQKKIDVIHSHSGCFFNAAIFAYFANVKNIIFTAHGIPEIKSVQARIEDRISASITSYIVVVSEELKGYYQEKIPSHKNKIVSIINGIDADLFVPVIAASNIGKIKKKFNIPGNKIILGTVGRLENVKNYPALIRSFYKLNSKYPKKIHLVFIGDGSEKERLEEMTKELSVHEDVSFLGMQYDLQNIIPVMDVFILSSLTEGTSVALLEAQSCGIPAIVTNVGGNGKIIRDNYNGFLCEVNNYTEMADKIELLIGDKALFSAMQKNARSSVVERYNISAMVKSYEQLYETLTLRTT